MCKTIIIKEVEYKCLVKEVAQNLMRSMHFSAGSQRPTVALEDAFSYRWINPTPWSAPATAWRASAGPSRPSATARHTRHTSLSYNVRAAPNTPLRRRPPAAVSHGQRHAPVSAPHSPPGRGGVHTRAQPPYGSPSAQLGYGGSSKEPLPRQARRCWSTTTDATQSSFHEL